MDLFDHLPVSALVNNKFLCVHGGISPDAQTVAFLLFRFKIFKNWIELEKYRNQAFYAI